MSNRDFTIWRRLQIKENLQWLFRLILGWQDGDKDSPSPPEVPHKSSVPLGGPPSSPGTPVRITTSDEDETVACIKDGIEKSIPKKGANDDHRATRRRRPTPTPKAEKRREDVIKGVQLLMKRVAPASKQTIVSEPNVTTTVGDYYDASAPEFIVSSLKVALPTRNMECLNTTKEISELSYEKFDHESFQSTGYNGQQVAELPSAGPTLLKTTQEDLTQILKNYTSWHREIYPNLPLEQESIRLVEILPGTSDQSPVDLELFNTHLREVRNAYTALSYVWGSPDPPQTVRLSGIEVRVNPNLFNALLSLRQADSRRRVWVDAICINQKDLKERSIEVRKMGEIYSSAETVAIFLGTSPSDAPSSPIHDVFKFLRSDGREQGESASNPNKDEGLGLFKTLCQRQGLDQWRVCKGFVEMCAQPWWSRVWIIQEFYLASDEPIWYWGSDTISNDRLKRDFQLLASASWKLLDALDAPEHFRSEVAKIMRKPHDDFRSDVERIFDLISRRLETDGYDIPRRLYGELTASATDPRDLVYGLREIFDPVFRKIFVPDYLMRPELLYACLAVFLIQFECWGDVLWWYPHRFTSGGDDLLTWLPDFSRRVKLGYLEPVPMKTKVDETPDPKMMILDHLLYAEGYILDTMYGHRHLDTENGHRILQELWQFDNILNSNHLCHRYIMADEEKDDIVLSLFLQMCKQTQVETDEIFVSAYKGAIIRSTAKSTERESLPFDVLECLPYFDILMWHCFGNEEAGISELLGNEIQSSGLLRDVFSSRTNSTFFKTMAQFFIGACMFDWDHLKILLDRFSSATMWSETNRTYWQATAGGANSHRATAIASAVDSFVQHILKEVMRANWGASWHYRALCFLILLDSDDHTSLVRMVTRLRLAAVKLREVAFAPPMEKQIKELASKNKSIATRLRNHNAVVERFKGRFLIWTDHGFRGVTAPGMDKYCCGAKPVILLLDGLSFPVIVRDFNEETGRGRLVGCAIIQGVDMLGGDVEKAKLPDDMSLKKKTVFKFK